jgi:hypothetical protein
VSARPATRPGRLLRAILALALGALAALLVACGSSGSGGLIPAAQGGPLRGDIEAVEKAAEAANGNCGATEAALLKTDQDFAALPSSLNSGLRGQLRLGIENLHKVAKEACAQPAAQTATTSTQKTTSTATTPTTTSTTPTQTTGTTATTPPPAPEGEETPSPGGGTPAPGEGAGKAPGDGAGGAGAEEAPKNNGAGGSEGGK